MEFPRVGGTCAGRIVFLGVTIVVTQSGSDIELLQTEPRPYGPYIGSIEGDGSFTATSELYTHTDDEEGLASTGHVEGEFSGSSLTGLETFTVFDAGNANEVAREQNGLIPGQTSCTFVVRWEGTRT